MFIQKEYKKKEEYSNNRVVYSNNNKRLRLTIKNNSKWQLKRIAIQSNSLKRLYL
jgi:hypothetical protein